MSDYDLSGAPQTGGASSLLDNVKDAGRGALGDVRSKAMDAVSRTTEAARAGAMDRAESAKDTLADSGERLAQSLREAVGGGDDSIQARLMAAAADTVSEFSNGLRGRSFGELLGQAEGFARRNPGAFVAAAALAGFAVARFARASSTPSSSYGRSYGSGSSFGSDGSYGMSSGMGSSGMGSSGMGSSGSSGMGEGSGSGLGSGGGYAGAGSLGVGTGGGYGSGRSDAGGLGAGLDSDLGGSGMGSGMGSSGGAGGMGGGLGSSGGTGDDAGSMGSGGMGGSGGMSQSFGGDAGTGTAGSTDDRSGSGYDR